MFTPTAHECGQNKLPLLCKFFDVIYDYLRSQKYQLFHDYFHNIIWITMQIHMKCKHTCCSVNALYETNDGGKEYRN